MKPYSNEFKLLLEASQIPPSTEVITELFNKGIHQGYLFSLAIANGVLPLLYGVLKTTSHINVDKSFQRQAIQIQNTNFVMSAQLLQIIHLLKEKKVELIPIKGPLLSQHAYKDISLRPFSDLDILAKEEDLLEISQTLLSLGYKSEKDLAVLKHPYILEKFSDFSFTHPQTGLVIELHWKLLKTATAVLSNIADLFENKISIPFQNTSLNSLPLEEEFLYLCLHGAKHRFERIEWMNDLNRLFELYHEKYDYQKLLSMAKKEDSLSSYLLALRILHLSYKRSISDTQTLQLMNGRKIKVLYEKVFSLHAKDYILQTKKEGIRWMELLFSIRLEDNFLKKIMILKSIIFPLYMDDILNMKKIPDSLTFLYYLKRLSRYIKTKVL